MKAVIILHTTFNNIFSIEKEILLCVEKTDLPDAEINSLIELKSIFLKIFSSINRRLNDKLSEMYDIYQVNIDAMSNEYLFNDVLLRAYLLAPHYFEDGKMNVLKFNDLIAEDHSLVKLLAMDFQSWLSALVCIQRLNDNAHSLLKCSNHIDHALIDLRPSGSDRHDNGEVSWVVKYDGRPWLVYKPRSGQSELLWNSLCKEIGLKVSNEIYCRGKYHFAKFVEQAERYSNKEFEDHFFNFGLAVSLAHIFNMNDLHEENIIAAKFGFCVIDCETLLHPKLLPQDTFGITPADLKVYELNQDSIYELGVLPFTMEDKSGRTIEKGGLANSNVVLDGNIRFEKIGGCYKPFKTDEVRLKNKNYPKNILGDENLLASYGEHFVNGYKQGISLLCAKSERLVAILEDHVYNREIETRVIIRNTKYYDFISNNFRLSILSGEQRYVEPFLVAPFINSCEQVTFRKLEKAAIDNTDIPRFVHNPITQSFTEPNSLGLKIKKSIRLSGFDRASKKLRDLERNSDAYINDIDKYFSVFSHKNKRTQPPKFKSVKEIARMAAGELCSEMVEVSRTLSWRQLYSVGDGEAFGFRHVTPGLYDGKAGVLLASHYGSDLDARSAFVFESLRIDFENMIVRNSGNDFASEYGKGAYSGVSGLIYAISYLNTYANLGFSTKILANFFGSIDFEHFSSDVAYDVASGNAGVILSLWLASNSLSAEAAYFKRMIVEIGEILFTTENVSKNFTKPGHEKSEFGFAHGNTGIALAAIRLFDLTHDYFYANLAFELLCNEYTDAMKYPRLDARFCRGLTGLAFTLCIAEKSLPMHTDIQKMLIDVNDVLPELTPLKNDTLCCGTLGVNLYSHMHRSSAMSHFDHTYQARCIAGDIGDNLGLYRGACSHIIYHALITKQRLGNILLFE